MHDEPKMPSGNLGSTDRAATPDVVRPEPLSDEAWLKARDDRHMRKRQFTGESLTDWPVPSDIT